MNKNFFSTGDVAHAYRCKGLHCCTCKSSSPCKDNVEYYNGSRSCSLLKNLNNVGCSAKSKLSSAGLQQQIPPHPDSGLSQKSELFHAKFRFSKLNLKPVTVSDEASRVRV
uniref:Uncharacterized protein n=1 Tax=Nelumbo nucifera TaxID=4432 RepID=A0A822Z9S3_NELNU|nr:TPA_asm: hypothetical protein HUJ06_008919 [Nelumbo nucifera]